MLFGRCKFGCRAGPCAVLRMRHFLDSALDMSPDDAGGSERKHLNESSPGSGDSRSFPHLQVRFGLYEVNLQTCELRKGGLRLKIPHQSFQILAMLLERPGQVITREVLKRELWPTDVFVNFERSLNSAVQKLRSVLRDTSRKPRYIETLPREGYRFIASVQPLMPFSTEVPQGAATLGPAELPAVNKTSDELPTVVSVQARNWRPWAAAVLVLVLGFAWCICLGSA